MNDNERQLLTNAFTMRRELIQKLLDDTRNLDLECGYPDSISVADYQRMYDRNGVSTRVAELLPNECWNVVPEIAEDEKETETEFEKTWKELDRKFHFCHYLHRLDVLSGVGQYGVLLIGLNDGKKLSEEVKADKCELTYLKPFSEYFISIGTKEKDVSSPRYGLPVTYLIKSENLDGTLDAVTTTSVHWTRVIHVADNRGVSDVYGIPRMQSVYNYLLDLKKLLGGSAEMFWKGGFPGYAFEVNKERSAALTPEEKTELRTEFLNFSNKLQRYIALVGITAKSLEMQVADPKGHFDTQIKAIGITLGVPYRIFMGSEEAKIASQTDTKTWSRRVSQRQVNYLTPLVVRPFVDRLIELGIMPEPKEYVVKWPSLDEIDPKDAATIAKDKTESLSKYVTTGTDTVIPPFQFLTLVMGFTKDEAEAIIKEAESYQDDREDEEDLDEDENDED